VVGSLVFGFWGVSMLLALTPGVDWAYAIASGLRPRGAFPAVAGLLSGHLIAAIVVAAGVAAVFAGSDTAMTVLTLAGACYLVRLGVSAVRDPAAPDLDSQAAPTGRLRLAAKGVGVSLLNPKVFLLFLALLPQFTRPDSGWPVGVQMLVLGVLHVLNCAVVYFAVGYGASTLLTKHPQGAQVVSLLSGIVMIVLGVVLAAERFLPLH
jgi:threonine/homoserine/homoserine lactone efflux protein